MKYVFNEKELSSIVQQAQDVNASSVDLTPARLREKEKQLGQCEALLKDAKARIADLEKQRIDATLAYEAEIGVLYNRVEFLTSDLTASNDELSQLKNKVICLKGFDFILMLFENLFSWMGKRQESLK